MSRSLPIAIVAGLVFLFAATAQARYARPQLDNTPVERLVKEMWPTATVVPEMSTGATDGLDVRNGGIPVYGVGALFGEEGDSREHGRDERVGVDAFHRSTAFWYQLVKALTSGDKTT